MNSVEILKKCKNGYIPKNLQEENILDEYRMVGMIRYIFKNPISKPIAKLTELGERYLHEKTTEQSLIGKIFKNIPF